MIQIGGVYTTFCQEEGILCKSIAIEMGGVSRYFSKVSGAGVDLTLLKYYRENPQIDNRNRQTVTEPNWGHPEKGRSESENPHFEEGIRGELGPFFD